MTIGIVSHPACAGHEMGDYHPESPARLGAIEDRLISTGLDFVLRHFEPEPVDPALLELVHNKDYIESIFAQAPQEGTVVLDGDTSMCPKTLNAALLAAGSAVLAVDKVVAKEVSAAFCEVRPPGHHAERDKAMGFCLFNNVAVGAAYARQQYGIERIAILDFDVHHGNGTQDFVSDKDGYLFCSTFQHPLFPFSGTEPHPDHIINTPLEATASSTEFREAVERDWLPALHRFQPQMVFISAGFDAHAEDDMSQVRLYESDYLWVTQQIRAIADQYAEGRIVSVLEGGYSLDALGRSVVAHLNGLIGK
ncbi:histone deacetylase family protein [Biformimicrobium ophioploci]|uniref:Histone deacetylase family protein n=1 Tax=Biformimicrobium ophioploci TaxID=3036711 RepID=A0ABQ6M140_9GAMM|nr:histone deacetylase family protein [Microbulbifer sp. NKW57]GMG88053.1 histone deacetylase family protein [Microbulbifer sp. NKW57]